MFIIFQLIQPVKNVQKVFVVAVLTGCVEFLATGTTVCLVLLVSSVIMGVHALSGVAINITLGLVALQMSMLTPATQV